MEVIRATFGPYEVEIGNSNRGRYEKLEITVTC